MGISFRSCFAIAALVCASVFSGVATAAPGDFDNTFGSGLGKILQPLGVRDDSARGVMILPNRKLLIHGLCERDTLPLLPDAYCLARFNENGSLDASFGTNGRVIADLSAINRTPWLEGIPRNIVRLADGRIIFAMTCQKTNPTQFAFCLVGYTENGALDTSFGTNGYATFDVGGAVVMVVDMALQADGKVLVAARCDLTANSNLSQFCITRFLANGNSDGNGFGAGGFVNTQILDRAEASGLAIDDQGRVVLAGRCRSNAPSNSPYLFCAARYTSNGQLDASFGDAGIKTQLVGSGNGGGAATGPVIVQPDGNIIITGQCRLNNFSPSEFCMLRLLPNGSVDNLIGAAGLLWTSGAARGSEITSAQLTPDGKYLFGGVCYTNPNNFDTDFCAMRIKNDGSRDLSFGTNGQVIHPIGSARDDLSGIAVTSDGKIVVAGACEGASNVEFCIARLDGGPGAYRACSPDLDGDGRFVATVDGLIQQRVLSGVTGAAVVNGVNFSASASRTNWAPIRQFLVAQCGMDLPQ